MKVEFKPWARPDKRYAFQIFVDDKPVSFIWFIETTNQRVATCDRGDITCGTTYSLEECQANCNWLNKRVFLDEVNGKNYITIGEERK